MTINVANGEKAKNPLGQSAKVRQALELSLDRDAINQVVFNGEFVPGNQWINPEHSYYQKSLPIPKRDVAKAKALLKEAGVTGPVTVDFMVPQGAENKAVVRGGPGDGGGSRLRHEDPRHRVRDLAQAGRAGRISGLPDRLERAAPIRTAISTSSTRPRRRRTTAASPTRRSTRRSTTRG